MEDETIRLLHFQLSGRNQYARCAAFEADGASYDKRLKIEEPRSNFIAVPFHRQAPKLVGIDYMARFAGFGYADLSMDYWKVIGDRLRE